jgi:hypothetical protein
MRQPELSMSSPPVRAWWREPMMWLVVGGPAVVVVAAIGTAFIAMHAPDPVLTEDYYRRGLAMSKAVEEASSAAGLAAGHASDLPAPALRPALQARNHAATPTEASAPATGRAP